MENSGETTSREELLDLYKHYRNSIKDEIDFFYKFFNFYVGLLSAILVATIAGFLKIEDGKMLDLGQTDRVQPGIRQPAHASIRG